MSWWCQRPSPITNRSGAVLSLLSWGRNQPGYARSQSLLCPIFLFHSARLTRKGETFIPRFPLPTDDGTAVFVQHVCDELVRNGYQMLVLEIHRVKEPSNTSWCIMFRDLQPKRIVNSLIEKALQAVMPLNLGYQSIFVCRKRAIACIYSC